MQYCVNAFDWPRSISVYSALYDLALSRCGTSREAKKSCFDERIVNDYNDWIYFGMKRVVSGGPARRPSPHPRPSRPSGYNPVELSRFAGGALPLVFLSPACLALAGSSATLSPSNSLSPRFHPPDPRPWVARDARFLPVFTGFSHSAQGISAPPPTTVIFKALSMMAFVPPGYELSKPTPDPSPS